jgi:FkbM family methyltransferase
MSMFFYAEGELRRLVYGISKVILRSRIKGVWRISKLLHNAATGSFISACELPCRMKNNNILELRPAADHYERMMYIERTYEAATLHFMDQHLKPGSVYVDVGANIGMMTLHAARIVGTQGHVYSFEPHPDTFRRLGRNIELNGIGNITTFNFALGAVGDEREIYAFPEVNIGRASLIRDEGSQLVGAVKVRTLDEVLNDVPVSMMKIDVEGFEAEVLRGALESIRRYRPLMIVEVIKSHPSEHNDPLAAHKLIMNTGLYDCFKFRESKFVVSELDPVVTEADIPEHDNLFYLPRR